MRILPSAIVLFYSADLKIGRGPPAAAWTSMRLCNRLTNALKPIRDWRYLNATQIIPKISVRSVPEDQEDNFTVNERGGDVFTQEMCL